MYPGMDQVSQVVPSSRVIGGSERSDLSVCSFHVSEMLFERIGAFALNKQDTNRVRRNNVGY
jgi:hypothetical protein